MIHTILAKHPPKRIRQQQKSIQVVFFYSLRSGLFTHTLKENCWVLAARQTTTVASIPARPPAAGSWYRYIMIFRCLIFNILKHLIKTRCQTMVNLPLCLSPVCDKAPLSTYKFSNFRSCDTSLFEVHPLVIFWMSCMNRNLWSQ